MLDDNDAPNVPQDVRAFVKCKTATLSSPLRATGGGYSYRSKGGGVVTCAFDRAQCADKQLEKNSDDFLKGELGLGKVAGLGFDPGGKFGGLAGGAGAGGTGGDDPRKPSSGGSSPKNFCACATTKKPVDPAILQITDAVRKIASFGQAGESEALRQDHEYASCGKWYFPDKKGSFASVSEEEQPFVGAWKWALVKECSGGGE